MSDESPLFDRLQPPREGWSRLTARRDERASARATGLALASGVTIATLALILVGSPRVPATALPLPPSAARLIDTRSTGAPVTIDSATVEALPSATPGVKLYWIIDR